MILPARLDHHGVTVKKLKSAFTNVEKGSKAEKLVRKIHDNIQQGVDRNLRDYRLFWALDRAYDTPFYQVSYTQLAGLIDKKTDSKDVINQVNRWGLSHMLPDVLDKNGKPCCIPGTNTPQKALSLPVFFNIFVPLVCAYVTIRRAKLFLDRNLVPLYKYEPIKFNKKNRLRGEIWTERIQVMTNQFDYASDEDQAILQTLVYGRSIKFPREAWYTEKQEDENGKARIVKEGLRFNLPHISRTYHDLYSRLSTLNADAGIKHLGYWEVCRYADIKNNPDYWNKDKVTFGAVSWFHSYMDFFSTVYPCVLKWPSAPSSGVPGSGTMDLASGAMDREAEVTYYSSDEDNAATIVNQHFEKLIPKDWGLGSYEYPVWFRFVMGNAETVHYAEPLCFTPGAYYGYDPDENRSRNKSLALEVLPFQDQISQILSQWALSVRQNLINPTFVNTDVVPQEIINQLDNTGEKLLRSRIFVPFSDTENIRTQTSIKEPFLSPQLTNHDTAQLAFFIKGILDIVDRVLVLSSQEIGQTGPHEQTAEEIRAITTTTSTRLDFTGTFIDRGIYATKKMLYEATMAYGDDNVTAQISGDYADTEAEFKKMLKEINFEIDDKDDDGANVKTTRRGVKGSKSSIPLEIFSSSRDAKDRIDNPGLAAAMAQIFTAVAGNQLLFEKIGAEQLVEMLNDIMHTMGFPKERNFKVQPGDPSNQQQQLLQFAEQVKQAIQQSSEETAKQVLDETAKALQPVTQAITQLAQSNQTQDAQIEELSQAIIQINQVIAAAAQATPLPQQQPMYAEPQQVVPIGL